MIFFSCKKRIFSLHKKNIFFLYEKSICVYKYTYMVPKHDNFIFQPQPVDLSRISIQTHSLRQIRLYCHLRAGRLDLWERGVPRRSNHSSISGGEMSVSNVGVRLLMDAQFSVVKIQIIILNGYRATYNESFRYSDLWAS